MLEEIAIKYISQSESALTAIAYGLTAIGGIVAAIITRSKTEIARATYFAYSCLIILFVSATQIVWLHSLDALASGYLWTLMMISVAASVFAGFYIYRIAMARSRDAYGHGRLAFLAFIPVGNLWLLFTPSKSALSANRVPTVPLLTGGLGVLTGFVLLAATGGIAIYIQEQALQLEQRAATEPRTQQAGIDYLIRAHGLEAALQLMTEDSQTPVIIDDVTTLVSIEATGAQLLRTYAVEVDGMTMTKEFRKGSRYGICAYAPFEPLLRAGASIREVYVERDGREIGTVVVTQQECGF